MVVDKWFVFGCIAAAAALVVLILAIREIGRPGSFGYRSLAFVALFWVLICFVVGLLWGQSKTENQFTHMYFSYVYGIRCWFSSIILFFFAVLCFLGAIAAFSVEGEVTKGRFIVPSWQKIRAMVWAGGAQTPAMATAPRAESTPEVAIVPADTTSQSS